MIKMTLEDYKVINQMLIDTMQDSAVKYTRTCGRIDKQAEFYREIGRHQGVNEVMDWFIANISIII